MGVDSHHPAYQRRMNQWKRCRDAAGGTDTVKAAGVAYLPMLDKQTPEKYDSYKRRALYYNATGRTVAALLGAVYRKNPDFDVPDEAVLEHLTVEQEDAWSFGQTLIQDLLTVGRLGLLVDVLENGEPRIALYAAEDIFNWAIADDGALVQVRLMEEYSEPDAKDPWSVEVRKQIRVLSLMEPEQAAQALGSAPETERRVYRQDVFRKRRTAHGEQDAWELVETTIPNRNGVPLDFLPFLFINPTSLTVKTEDPPLLELADVNLSHYRTSADLEHGAHYTALPTPVATGWGEMDTKLSIGPGEAWVTDQPQAKAYFLEFTGSGLGALERLMDSKERKMAVLGARMLEESKKAAEAADTLRLRASGENGVLSSISRMASEGLGKALQWLYDWRRSTGVVEVRFNTDFLNEQLSPQTITALMQAYQQGALSLGTFLWNLERGELLPPGVDAEEEKERIDAEAPEVEPLSEQPVPPQPGQPVPPQPGQPVPPQPPVEEVS